MGNKISKPFEKINDSIDVIGQVHQKESYFSIPVNIASIDEIVELKDTVLNGPSFKLRIERFNLDEKFRNVQQQKYTLIDLNDHAIANIQLDWVEKKLVALTNRYDWCPKHNDHMKMYYGSEEKGAIAVGKFEQTMEGCKFTVKATSQNFTLIFQRIGLKMEGAIFLGTDESGLKLAHISTRKEVTGRGTPAYDLKVNGNVDVGFILLLTLALSQADVAYTGPDIQLGGKKIFLFQ